MSLNREKTWRFNFFKSLIARTLCRCTTRFVFLSFSHGMCYSWQKNFAILTRLLKMVKKINICYQACRSPWRFFNFCEDDWSFPDFLHFLSQACMSSAQIVKFSENASFPIGISKKIQIQSWCWSNFEKILILAPVDPQTRALSTTKRLMVRHYWSPPWARQQWLVPATRAFKPSYWIVKHLYSLAVA